MQTSSQINQLLEIMHSLRTPKTGCPWDLEQNFASIAPYTIEEAYEVADAIDRKDMGDLRDELGDLLFQVVFQAQIAKEAGLFDFDDIVQAISDKMIRRHPHVFGTQKIADADAQTEAWEQQKAKERATKGEKSRLDDIPIGLPATLRALKIQSRAARSGFDWPDLSPVFAKLQEEVSELQDAINTEPQNMDDIESELGDLLFVCINLSMKFKLNPERALNQTNLKFIRRFQYIETALAADGKTPEDVTLDEMDRLWDEAKSKETVD
ncbi:MAG: nucleoside triphosphate pyrophosphohydrolase [Robiginitomaculum sp.]|nr:MAG: nucleoside triphosphate pyrophosphohydrolase [Robiginitomaculum sp.]